MNRLSCLDSYISPGSRLSDEVPCLKKLDGHPPVLSIRGVDVTSSFDPRVEYA